MTSSATNDAPARRPPGAGSRFPRAARLRRADDIRRTLRRGRRLKGPFVDVVWSSSPARRPRVAVIVPRYGNSAVARNRVRRRLVDIARTVWLPALLERERDIDFVYRAKPASYAASYETLRDSLTAPLEAVCAR